MTLAGLNGANLAYIFPGQGSQVVGMGQSLYASSPAARATIDEANEILGTDFSALMFEGPVETLNDTFNAQPALLVVSIAALRALEEAAANEGISLAPLAAAGHSLGEFTALVAAGSLPFPDMLRLVRERGRLMAAAGTERPGGMAAVLGLDDEALRAVCLAASDVGIINVANANCPGQIVISGEVAALEKAMEGAKAAGAKRVARLPVSIASHSPLMAEVSRDLRAIIDDLPWQAPAYPVVGNVSAAPIRTVDELRAELEHHVERPVNWTASVETMVALGVDTFVELGAGNVLAGLVKRIDRSVRTLGLADLGL
jgi:[acyl-carrier-protein] S-malonyltransferase